MKMRSDSFTDAKELSRLDDPIVSKRCIKLKRRSKLQDVLMVATWCLLFAGVVLLDQGSVGRTSRHGRYDPPHPVLIPYGQAALGLSLTALVGFFCCRNYYLLDPSARRLYHHFAFLGWRRRRLVFRQEDILGLTAEGRRKRTRYGYYWRYRLLAVGCDGRQEPLSNWKREGLDAWNAKAAELAPQLGCRSFKAPGQATVAVEQTAGQPALRFI